MKKIGTTSAGSVIVEMSSAEFDAIEARLSHTNTKPHEKLPFTPEYVLPRLLKSKPGTKEAATHFIAAMFQFQSGVSARDIEGLLAQFQKVGALKIDESEKIAYKKA